MRYHKTLYIQKILLFSLTPSSDYIGPKEIFGMEIPDTQPFVDIVRNVSDKDVDIMSMIHEGEEVNIPTSLKKSIHWFY